MNLGSVLHRLVHARGARGGSTAARAGRAGPVLAGLHRGGHVASRAARACVAIVFLACASLAQSAGTSDARAAACDRAVEACRRGNVEAGLVALRALNAADSTDARTASAYVVELHRSGDVSRVVEVFPTADLSRVSDEALEAIARSLHAAGRTVEGDQVWSRLEQRRFHDAERARAVAAARAGRHAEALATLKALHEFAPHDARVLGDTLVVSNWAGDDEGAVRLGAELDRAAAPDYVLEAYGRSLRNVRRYPEAVAVYRELVERAPTRRDVRLGLAYALAEAKQNAAARAELDVLAAGHPDDVDVLLARATIHRWIGEPFEAFAVLDRLARTKPDDATAQRLRVHTWLDLGAVHAANDEARAHPNAITADDAELLELRRATQLVGWVTASAGDPASVEHDAVRAAEILERLVATTKDAGVRARARSNLWILWKERGRTRDVVKAYEADEEAHVAPDTLTPQAWIAVGDAYAAERRFEDAVAPYRRALASLREANRDRFQASVGLHYALLGAERYDEAGEVVDELAAAEPAWITSFGGAPRENPLKLSADRHALVRLSWSDRLAEVSDVLEHQVERAPYNVDLRADLAAIHVWRGWPSRALEEARIARAIDPAHVGARAALIRAYLGRREYDMARDELDALVAVQPENGLVRELHEDWAVRKRWELVGSLDYGKSTDDGVFGSREYGAEAHLYTRPLAEFTRAFVHGLARIAEFDEGIARVYRVGVGLEHERRLWNARGEVHVTWQHETAGVESSPGFDVALGLTPDDHWNLRARYESDSLETPLRGRFAGVEGRRLALDTSYTLDERTRVALDLSRLETNDDNVRESGVLSLSQRVVTLTNYDATVTPRVSTSHNSLGPAPVVYFNPSRDWEFGFDLTNEWRSRWRRDDALAHRLIGTLAIYDQDEFDPSWTGALRFEQDVRLGRATSYTYGIGVASYAFDGDREARVWVYLRPDWRF